MSDEARSSGRGLLTGKSCSTPTPGTELGEALPNLEGSDGESPRSRTEDGLRATVIDVLTHYGGHSATQAERLVNRGAWMTDPIAAAHLCDGDRAVFPFGVRLRNDISRESVYQQGRRRAIDRIAGIAIAASDENRLGELAVADHGSIDRFEYGFAFGRCLADVQRTRRRPVV